jgi:hypothetical protein
MPTNTYTPLATITLTGTDSNITFASIPNTYRDLILVCNYVTYGYTQIRFNSDSSSIYSTVTMYGNGSNTGSNTYTAAHIDTSNNVGDPDGSNVNLILQVMDYAQTDKHKSTLLRVNQGGTGGYAHAQANRYATTTAISSINVIQTGYFGIGSTFSLYGVIA